MGLLIVLLFAIYHRLLFSFGFCLLLSSSPSLAQEEGTPTNNDVYEQLQLFGQAFDIIQKDYVESPETDKLIESAIDGMLRSLDPHSGFLSANSFKEMREQTRGDFGGLGIEVTMEEGLVKVISPIDDTPAAKAGLEAGDFISLIDDEPVFGMSLNEAVKKMRGKIGSPIRVMILRENVDPHEVTIIRDRINIQAVKSRQEGDVGYIRISTFNEKTYQQLKKAIETIQSNNDDLVGFVIDLRNNPGGLLDQAIAVSDAFLDHGEIVSTRGRNDDNMQRFNAEEGDLARDFPLVVLINGGSASASEIVAGALQDHHRAIVMGTRSFGKGSVQTIRPMPGNTGIRMTTARYYTPSGRSIQAEGIEPHIVVPQARIEFLKNKSRHESDLRGALDKGTEHGKQNDNEDNKEDTKKDDGNNAADDFIEDYQLARALDLLRSLALARRDERPI